MDEETITPDQKDGRKERDRDAGKATDDTISEPEPISPWFRAEFSAWTMVALAPFLTRNGVKADLASVESVPASRLVDAVAMMAPFAPREKQALLEAHPQERAMLLTQLMEMSLLAEATPSGGGSPGASH